MRSAEQTSRLLLAVALLAAACMPQADAHAYLLYPPSRNYQAFTIPPDTQKYYCPHCGQGGGAGHVPGICGDPFQNVVNNPSFVPFQSRFYAATTLQENQEIQVSISVSTNHGGRMHLSVCPLPKEQVTQDCFDQPGNMLHRVNSNPEYNDKVYWYMNNGNSVSAVENFRLPAGVTCESGCMLQWWWTGFQACALPCEDPSIDVPSECGRNLLNPTVPMCNNILQTEQFANCADVIILPPGMAAPNSPPPTPLPIPADNTNVVIQPSPQPSPAPPPEQQPADNNYQQQPTDYTPSSPAYDNGPSPCSGSSVQGQDQQGQGNYFYAYEYDTPSSPAPSPTPPPPAEMPSPIFILPAPSPDVPSQSSNNGQPDGSGTGATAATCAANVPAGARSSCDKCVATNASPDIMAACLSCPPVAVIYMQDWACAECADPSFYTTLGDTQLCLTCLYHTQNGGRCRKCKSAGTHAQMVTCLQCMSKKQSGDQWACSQCLSKPTPERVDACLACVLSNATPLFDCEANT